MTDKEIKETIKYATANRSELEKSDMAGCYYCLNIFPASRVTDFVEGEDTALCPICGIDSVLPSNSPYQVNQKVLKKLNIYWFLDKILYSYKPM